MNRLHFSSHPQLLFHARQAWWIVRATAHAYTRDKLGRLGAALAFYTTVAVVPLLAVALMLADLVFDDATARQRIVLEIGQLAGTGAGQAVGALKGPIPSSAGSVAATIGAISLLIGATGVFIHLQDALNEIWRVRPNVRQEGWLGLLYHRLISMVTITATGFILLVSLIVSAALNWLDERTFARLAWPAIVTQGLDIIFSFLLIALLLTLVLKLIPDAPVNWKDAWVGGIFTALAFDAGKAVLSIYLAKASARAGLGMVGPLIALLLWAYYAAQILFVGAEITRLRTLARKRFAGAKAPTKIIRSSWI